MYALNASYEQGRKPALIFELLYCVVTFNPFQVRTAELLLLVFVGTWTVHGGQTVYAGTQLVRSEPQHLQQAVADAGACQGTSLPNATSTVSVTTSCSKKQEREQQVHGPV